MSMQEAIFWYAGIFCVLLAGFFWMLLKRKAEKAQNADGVGRGNSVSNQTTRKVTPWSAVLAFRPHRMLTRDMWLKTLIVAFITLCAGVIVVVFIFPLGAGWAAVASFVTVALLVVSFLFFMD